MTKQADLLNHLDEIHTTEMGVDRIRKNLKLDDIDVVEYCKKMICNPKCRILRKGKNWYCEIDDLIITVNAYSYTVITAHLVKMVHVELKDKIAES